MHGDMQQPSIRDIPLPQRSVVSAEENHHGNLGVRVVLQSPPLPFTFFCGNKKRPSELRVRVGWDGSLPTDVESIGLQVTVGKLNPAVEYQKVTPSLQTLEVVLKLSSGYELRPVQFLVALIGKKQDGSEVVDTIKDAHCVLMTAPSTQRHKALSSLAWQELEPLLTPYTSPMKSAKTESVCHISLFHEMMEGRWFQTLKGRPFPAEFTQLLDTLSKRAFFHSHLTHTRNQPTDPLYYHLQEKEFRSIWGWYESVMAFIEEYPALYFDLGLPQVQSRAVCEQQLQHAQDLPRTFSVRFASEESVVSLSLFKRGAGCSHTKIVFKQIKQLIRYVLVLERYQFVFIGKGGRTPPIFPQMTKLPMFKSQQPVRQEMNACTEPVASISDAVASDFTDDQEASTPSNDQVTFPLTGGKRERSPDLDSANTQPQPSTPFQFNLSDSQDMRIFFDQLTGLTGDNSFLDELLDSQPPTNPAPPDTSSPGLLFQSSGSKFTDEGNTNHPFVNHNSNFLMGGNSSIPSSRSFAPASKPGDNVNNCDLFPFTVPKREP